MPSLLADAWIRAADDDLIRADVITELACQDGMMTARLASGCEVCLAGPGCPAGFQDQFLAALALARVTGADQRTVIITARADASRTSWTWTTSRVSAAQPGTGSTAGPSPDRAQSTAPADIRPPRALHRRPPR